MDKKIGFLSFGNWNPGRGSQVRTGREALVQSVELAVAAEELGLDGAYFRVHHFARQLAAPFPLLAAVAARTSRIEIGTGVIDMRYENPLYMAEEAAITDLLADGRLQLGISRGSPETALRGASLFGYRFDDDGGDLARQHTELFRAAIAGAGVADADPRMTGGVEGRLGIQPRSDGLPERIWWGSGTRGTAVWTGEQGMNLMSSTLLTEDTGIPFDELQAEQIERYRAAFAAAGHGREPRVSVSRSVMPVTTDEDRMYFGDRSGEDQVGILDGMRSRFGKTYAGPPDQLAEELSKDAAVREADTLLLTVPNMLGVDYNARLLETVVREVAPAIGWTPKA
ncbi:Flavin-dependent oxidoreductase, luciferase family (includes alkanesulfonate monooxygenase SsuD and methylene tetrahydromethanopterin reductase) [Klenkia soli]|uniref:Flavin-dependent oxidoreductase, luciferase family (Includes alkanesulfonate monooxygenase SsuD and methylene tetrahydromethanopterin reductase) n=1 Tax=Klenkia soli TaxID=1052260 RepID=A0A1H0KFT8_9ACTN|nr:LLM class flavin-dependent oxidoreductase [Klenkia soli]SDO54824.1 Flavin-dependent oxidoreductase, luciferase family (includes alkanesulfonate monooxygenase SsuD and methylene tetrahydromethanopterin reductase) [Klenkia soli]